MALACWACKATSQKTVAFCTQCGKVQGSVPLDPFSRLDTPRGFDLDLAQLEKTYFDLQKKLHPDRFQGKSEVEKRFSLQQSMDINDAYQRLKNPLTRAQALLALDGVSVNTDQDTQKPSPALLMEIMELREAVEEAKSVEAIASLEAGVTDKHEHCLRALSAAFEEKTLENAAESTLRLGYLTKLRDEVQARRKQLLKAAS